MPDGRPDDEPRITTVPDERVPDVQLNDAHRRLWLEPRTEPESEDDAGFYMPAGGIRDSGGASAAIYVGGDPNDESTEFVPVGTHAAPARDPEPSDPEVHVRGLNNANMTATG
jgi:hypothetical protein